MEIKKLSAALNAYRVNSYEHKERKPQKTSSPRNTDVIELSASAKSLEGAKAAAVRSTDGFASPERISALKAQINAGTYNVSAEKVAAAIIDG